MTNLKALRALEAKVVAGTDIADWREFSRAFGLRPDDRHVLARNAHVLEDMNAALSLLKAVLPDWVWLFPHTDNCQIHNASLTGWGKGYSKDNPARALLLAIIRALIWEAS